MLWTAATPVEARAKRRACPKMALHESSAAKLYVRDSADDESHELVACVKATRRRTVLADWYSQGSSTDDPAPQSWLTGRFAAINQASCPGDPNSDEPCTGTVRVIDLRTRRTYATVSAGSPIFELVLTRRGSVGMIHRDELITAIGPATEVQDRQPQAGSLAYAPNAHRLYWMSQGQPRSATLP